ncbi:SDR family oxidoreductase [Synechococcus sp. CS-1328]|uniref:SDR family NAD(P)-dependent oxidoreductase n=1 Tax=Synechococcus sp. CS-1328 TaxID=2847976 RepID=UPI00223AC48B|nr:SDR family oxidoreductase [Synechococcus sp. CS-1328]MCT0225478.1 SDR family oxidoreductase [Synechococcus sp. CS-1328]
MDPASDNRDPFLPQLEEEDRARIAAALRYMGRDLQHRSYAVNTERRELLWQEMDRCLALAERIDPQPGLVDRPKPGTTKPCTLITGASSGIGAALARQLAPSLAGTESCLVLTARRLERLEALAADLRERHGIEVITIPTDLARPEGAQELLVELQQRQLVVHTLVNNAGFGLRGNFNALEWKDAEAMLQLMVVACAELCHGLLPAMQQAGGGCIVNVASLAGLMPGLPGSTLYSACKAFLIRFSQSLALENRPSGVRVMALCPGYVHSEFHAVLGVEEQMQRLPGLFWMDADELARQTLAALEGNQVVVVPGAVNQAITALARLLPEGVVTALSTTFSRRYRNP